MAIGDPGAYCRVIAIFAFVPVLVFIVAIAVIQTTEQIRVATAIGPYPGL